MLHKKSSVFLTAGPNLQQDAFAVCLMTNAKKSFAFLSLVFLAFFLKDDLPTARDLMIRYATNKKTTKRKKKLEKAMKVLKVRSA